MAIKIFAGLFFAILAGCGQNTKQTGLAIDPATTQFTVTADNAPNSYTVNNRENGSITMKRGNLYTFNVRALNHPFYIFYAVGGNPANAYTNGVSGNGVEVGILTFTVPATAPNTLYYGSSLDQNMYGTITIEN